MHDKLIVLDLRNEDTIYAGKRFMIYALYPTCEISIRVLWDRNRQNKVFAVGKSIINRSSTVNVGELMLEHGGGHQGAGTCQIENERAKSVLLELIQHITESPRRRQATVV